MLRGGTLQALPVIKRLSFAHHLHERLYSTDNPADMALCENSSVQFISVHQRRQLLICCSRFFQHSRTICFLIVNSPFNPVRLQSHWRIKAGVLNAGSLAKHNYNSLALFDCVSMYLIILMCAVSEGSIDIASLNFSQTYRAPITIGFSLLSTGFRSTSFGTDKQYIEYKIKSRQ